MYSVVICIFRDPTKLRPTYVGHRGNLIRIWAITFQQDNHNQMDLRRGQPITEWREYCYNNQKHHLSMLSIKYFTCAYSIMSGPAQALLNHKTLQLNIIIIIIFCLCVDIVAFLFYNAIRVTVQGGCS